MGPFLAYHAGYQVIEDMKVALASRRRLRDSGTLKVVFNGLQAVKPTPIVELQLGVVSEARGIVVVECMSVTEGLEDKLGPSQYNTVEAQDMTRVLF